MLLKARTFVLLTLIFISVKATKKKKLPVEKSRKPQEETVFERGLVTQDVKSSKIIKEFKSYSNAKNDVKNYDGVTLAYLTPWHHDAYQLSKIFKRKLSLVSPTWLSTRPMDDGNSLIEGLHNAQTGWMNDIRKDNDNIKIVPRINFEGWNPEDFQAILARGEKLNGFTDHLIRMCTKNKFDGLVVEMWGALSYQRGKALIHTIAHIGHRMRNAGKLFILVIPAPLGKSMRAAITREELADLVDYVDYFSLMTYDYATPQRPGPLSPLPWIKECVDFLADTEQPNSEKIREKILMGINFYGLMETEGQSVGSHIMNGDVYTKMLDRFMPKFRWDEKSGEHEGTFINDETNKVRFWYPTLYSLQKRLELAKSLNVGGISIWEIGQGLDYFFDLL